MKDSRIRFDEFAKELESSVQGNDALCSDLNKYLNGLRASVTGTAEYS